MCNAKMRGTLLTSVGLILVLANQTTSSRLLAALRKGLIPIQFTQYGPQPPNLLGLPPKSFPLSQKPPVKLPPSLPPNLPPQKTVRQMYQCLKTMLRPQLYQQMVVIPQLKRLLRSINNPVVETVAIRRPLPYCPYC